MPPQRPFVEPVVENALKIAEGRRRRAKHDADDIARREILGHARQREHRPADQPRRLVDADLVEAGFGKAPSGLADRLPMRSEEHTSELQSLMRISYAVFCLNKKTTATSPKQYHRSQQH